MLLSTGKGPSVSRQKIDGPLHPNLKIWGPLRDFWPLTGKPFLSGHGGLPLPAASHVVPATPELACMGFIANPNNNRKELSYDYNNHN